MGKEKKFAVLLCAEESDYVKKIHGGYLKVFADFLGDDGETWEAFRVVRGHFPEEAKLNSYDGFVVTGSCNDAHADDPWILRLIQLLATLHSMHKKVLGICFGHQVLCRALGGKTGRAAKGWDIGVTALKLLKPHKLLSTTQVPPLLTVIECHRDEAIELPVGAEVLAESEKTGIEMFRYGDHLMGIQGHPEYTKTIVLHLVHRLLNGNLIQSCQVEEATRSLEAWEPSREAWKKLCKGFLKGVHKAAAATEEEEEKS